MVLIYQKILQQTLKMSSLKKCLFDFKYCLFPLNSYVAEGMFKSSHAFENMMKLTRKFEVH